jgi:hypothetical protein
LDQSLKSLGLTVLKTPYKPATGRPDRIAMNSRECENGGNQAPATATARGDIGVPLETRP